jgi:hypothetical protein
MMVFKGIYHITSVLLSAFDRMLAYFDVTPIKITMLLVCFANRRIMVVSLSVLLSDDKSAAKVAVNRRIASFSFLSGLH